MEEHNKKTLIEALSSLPEYEPSEELWDNIEGEIGGADGDIVPPQLLLKLPQYEPPEAVWAGILKNLEAEKPQAKVVPLSWRQALAVAASLALLLVVFWQINRGTANEPQAVAVKYSVENVDPVLLVRDWDEDEDAFTEFLTLCEAKKTVCEQPEFKQLQGELDELTAAKDELKAAISEYTTEAEMVLQIKEIELERTDVLKKMMAMLI
ncbi:MAG: hypothetical protein HY842_04055 [Bacteroidetes bacterium]|nr:hypothetical protein [Bacteroidota bacterium]